MAQATSPNVRGSDIADALALWTRLTPTRRQQRILLGIARFFYSSGTCFARQVTIATKLKIPKTTLQREIADLELLGYLLLTRREGTSTMMTFKPGLIEAFNQIRRDRRLAFLVKKHSEKKSTAFLHARSKSGPNMASSETKPKHTSSTRNLRVSRTTTNTRGDAFAKKPTCREEAETTALLVSEGVTASRAATLARIHDAQAIRHAIAIGMHRTGRNPAGYLCYLIVNRLAENIPAPNSEAAIVRSQEGRNLTKLTETKAAAITHQSSNLKQSTVPSPSTLRKTQPEGEALTALFDRLDPSIQLAFELRAKVTLSFKPTFTPSPATLARITRMRAAHMYFEATQLAS